MSEPQDAIDVVLKALRAAEPSVGFEARMNHALQQGVASQRTWRTPFVWMTCVALLCAVGIGVAFHGRHVNRSIADVMPVRTRVDVLATAPEVALHRPTAKTRTMRLQRVAKPIPADVDVTMTHENIPPPPLPLTQEERLVLRMMRHNDLPQLATLSSEARARSLHDDAEEYRTFFAPRPPLNGQPYYDQHISGGSQ